MSEQIIVMSVTGAATVMSDIEEARNDHSEEESVFNQTEGSKNAESTLNNIESIKKVEVERVIVLSFRTLQLQRIAELQDELLEHAVRGLSGTDQTQNKDVVDQALQKYGKGKQGAIVYNG